MRPIEPIESIESFELHLAFETLSFFFVLLDILILMRERLKRSMDEGRHRYEHNFFSSFLFFFFFYSDSFVGARTESTRHLSFHRGYLVENSLKKKFRGTWLPRRVDVVCTAFQELSVGA